MLDFQQFINRFKYNADLKRVLINTLALFVIQGSNYLIPLITLRHLNTHLGMAGFGTLAFAQLIWAYPDQLTNYGFAFSAPKEVAQNRDNPAEINRIFNRVFFTKLSLGLVLLAIMALIVPFIPKLADMKTLMWVGGTVLIANIVTMDWFFQGIEQMKNITYLNLGARVVSLMVIFGCVQDENDLVWAFLATPLSQIVVGIIAILMVFRRYNLHFIPPQYFAIFQELRAGFDFVASQYVVRFYSADINITILGFLTNNATVGAYTLANRLFGFAITAFTPISQATYPYLARLFATDKLAFKQQIKTLSRVYWLLNSLMAAFLFIAAPHLIYFFSDNYDSNTILILRILSIAVIFASFGGFFTQIFIFYDRQKDLLKINASYILVNFVTLIPLYFYFQEIGIAINCVLVYLAVLLVPYFMLREELRIFRH